VAGYWNGSVFVPIDFSLHRESKKSKLKYGLTAKQRKAQKHTQNVAKQLQQRGMGNSIKRKQTYWCKCFQGL